MEDESGGLLQESCSNLLFDFVIKFSDVMQQPQDYGTGDPLNMIERHLLKYIGKHPGITVSKLAKTWRRTKGAISQQVKKLESNGYIEKKQYLFNDKVYLLYVTPQGEKINDDHKQTDIVITERVRQRLLCSCTEEEVDTFYKVMREFIAILEDVSG